MTANAQTLREIAERARREALEEAARICEDDVSIAGDRSLLAHIRDNVIQLVLADKIRALAASQEQRRG